MRNQVPAYGSAKQLRAAVGRVPSRPLLGKGRAEPPLAVAAAAEPLGEGETDVIHASGALRHRGLAVAILGLCAGLGGTCDRDDRCGDSVGVDTVYFESGHAARDSLAAQCVFAEYVTHVEQSGAPFPDGAHHWVYLRTHLDPKQACFI